MNRPPAPRKAPRLRRILATGLLSAAIAAATGSAATAAPLSPAGPTQVAQHGRVAQATRSAGGSPAKSTPSAGQITWSLIPSSATEPDTRAKFSYTNIAPGATVKDHVAILNRSNASVSFSVYATDATGTTSSNALTFLEAGKKPRDIGSWVQFMPSHATMLNLVIGPKQGIVEAFDVAVPTFATPGDHTGGLVAQVGESVRNPSGQRVIEYQRIVVPLELRVTGAYKGGLQVESVSSGFNVPVNPFGTGSASIGYTVTNVGNVRLTGTAYVTVKGPFGMKSVVEPLKLPTILPGDSARITASAPGLYPAGPMNATVSVTPGWPSTAPALNLPLAKTAESASLFAVPWSLLGLIALIIALAVAVWWLLRWRRRQQDALVAAAISRARKETAGSMHTESTGGTTT
ncbi:MAG TPA: hypothetical protein VMU95_18790 [Trebonia sp.]|nr:hypothetical protein [Trebonia sp.]